MKSFETNLKSYMESLHFTVPDIMAISTLTASEFSLLEKGPKDDFDYSLLYKFCFNTGISIMSVFDDTGFKECYIEDDYNKLPSVLKGSISSLFIKKLTQLCGNKDILKSRLRKPLSSETLISRIVNGTSSIESSQLKNICKEFQDLLPESETRWIFAKLVYSRIANYNFKQAAAHFNLSYNNIANVLGMTPSGVSNWGCIKSTHIPQSINQSLCSILGVQQEIFTTKLFNPSDYKYAAIELANPELNLNKGQSAKLDKGKLLDPVSKESKSVDKAYINSSSKTPLTSLPDPVCDSNNKEQSVSNDLTSECSDNLSEFEISISESDVLKMFKTLKKENKRKVNELISKLFLTQFLT